MDEIKAITEDALFEIVTKTNFKFDLLLKDYYVTVLLYLLRGISGIYFKGGTALQKIFLNYSRISEDIDYTLTRPIAEVSGEVEAVVKKSRLFGKMIRDKEVKGFTRIVVHYSDFNQMEKTVFIDLNERGKLLLPPENKVIPHFYPENIPAFSMPVLNSKEMMAEKMAAAIGRNRPRDHYDLYKIIQNHFHLDLELVKQKCISSDDKFDIIKMFNKAQRLKNRWDADIAPLLVEQITFQEVMGTLAKHFHLKEEKEKKKNEDKEKKIVRTEIKNEKNYQKILLPTAEQCLDWFKEYKVPPQIKEHCLYVQKVADFLAVRVSKKGIAVRTDFVHCLALLHDLFKVVSLKSFGPSEKYPEFQPNPEEIKMWRILREKYPDQHEGEVSYLIFKKDYPELALSLRKVSTPGIVDRSWEEAIVHYADWRVNHNQVVSLKERLDYLKKTYPKCKKKWENDEKIIREFENKLMGLIKMPAEDLAEEIKK